MLTPGALAALTKLAKAGELGPADTDFQTVLQHAEELIQRGMASRDSHATWRPGKPDTRRIQITALGRLTSAKATPSRPQDNWPFPTRIR